jgi:crotonobetainyl-CoA:carnitine CoA-transferase CaiB-like acyl-CoA transferase
MSFPLYYAFEEQPPPPRSGAAHATIFPYGPFPAGDGKTVMLGLQNEREWKIFCEAVLERPELATDPRFDTNVRRVANREALTTLIIEGFTRLTAAEAMARLDSAGIANARVNDVHELWAHPQLAARSRWRTIGSPVGPLPALPPAPIRSSHAWIRFRRSENTPRPSWANSVTRRSISSSFRAWA